MGKHVLGWTRLYGANIAYNVINKRLLIAHPHPLLAAASDQNLQSRHSSKARRGGGMDMTFNGRDHRSESGLFLFVRNPLLGLRADTLARADEFRLLHASLSGITPNKIQVYVLSVKSADDHQRVFRHLRRLLGLAVFHWGGMLFSNISVSEVHISFTHTVKAHLANWWLIFRRNAGPEQSIDGLVKEPLKGGGRARQKEERQNGGGLSPRGERVLPPNPRTKKKKKKKRQTQIFATTWGK